MSDVSAPPKEWSYDYVGPTKPDAEEGESWYDTDDNRAVVFTDNSGSTTELTVTDHGQLTGAGPGDHRSDSNIIGLVDGVIDAETVDGQHASDIQTPSQTGTITSDTMHISSLPGILGHYVTTLTFGGNNYEGNATVEGLNGSYSYTLMRGTVDVNDYVKSVSTDGNLNFDSATIRVVPPHLHSI